MIILSLDGVTRHYGAHDVLSGASWAIRRGDVIGLVGPNGAGKSTLLRIVSGEDAPDGGSIYRLPGLSVARLGQEPALDPTRTVWQEALTAAPRLREVEAELRALEARMADEAVYSDPRRLQRTIEAHTAALEAYTAAGGQSLEGRLRALLAAMGFGEADLELPVAVLSGGQKKLLGLAKVLVEQPDLLLLDEPDNHLDLAGKRALEGRLNDYPGTVVIISHDRYLLDVVADRIVEVDEGVTTEYVGGYSEFEVEREARRAQAERAWEREEAEVRRLEAARLRIISWSSGGQNEKMIKRARNIERRIARMDRTERPGAARRGMAMGFEAARGSDRVLKVVGLDKSFGEEILFLGLDLEIWRGERVGLVGPNGAGKSVLLKVIRGEIPADAGTVTLGPSNTVGYYAQEHQTMDPSRTVIEEVRRVRPMTEGAALNFLGRFLFGRSMALKRVRELSGGEKSRLQMALLVLEAPNFLILDEPTNNFDIQSAEILEEALGEYTGTVLVVSHDRYFLDAVATRIVELDDGRLVDFPDANYTGYLAEKARRLERARASAAPRPPARRRR